jgi:epoxyqueuosine reductase QueG
MATMRSWSPTCESTSGCTRSWSTKRRSRCTDIFEVLFGRDEQAKHCAQEEFDRHYRARYGEAHPFWPGSRGVTHAKAEALEAGLGFSEVHFPLYTSPFGSMLKLR